MTVRAVLVSLLLAAPAAAAEKPADLLLTGGAVITLAPARPRATAVAVRDGRIVAVGGDADVQPFRGPRTRVVALAGGGVVPGLADAHVHVEGIGQAAESLDLVGAGSLQEALDRVAKGARALPPGEWLIGRGWDQNDWPEKRFPTAAELDRAAADRPVLLERVDGHASWANTRALAIAGITAATPDPPGGRILRDASGGPAGVLVDAAQVLAESKVPEPSRAVRKRRLAKGLAAAAAVGLTSVHDAGVSIDTIPLYKELLAEDALPVRVHVMLRGPGEFLEKGASLRPEHGLGDGRLNIQAIKVVADGALGSRGAWLLEPYSDEPGTRGLNTVDAAAFERLLAEAVKRGFQVATHAIGDAANRFVLDAYERAFAGRDGAALRFRVEHAQVLAAPDVPRFKRLGVLPSMQPTHCTSDMYWAGDRVGPERVKGAYLWKTFLDAGVRVPAGSDAPVERIDVLPGLQAAITRQDAKGWPPAGWQPQERVTLEQALRMFSQDAAFAAFDEQERGTIAVGMRADLTVLGADLEQVAPGALSAVPVRLTVVGGRVAHEAR
ncbi:MAG: amidohydrolase [Vicinamibacteria bacterium]